MTVKRWEHTRDEVDAANARRLMNGLFLLNSISDVPGFVGRGVSTDGRSHFAMGSDDQTFPWYLGLWRFHQSDLATDRDRDAIRQRFGATTRALLKNICGYRLRSPLGRGAATSDTSLTTPRASSLSCARCTRSRAIRNGNSDTAKPSANVAARRNSATGDRRARHPLLVCRATQLDLRVVSCRPARVMGDGRRSGSESRLRTRSFRKCRTGRSEPDLAMRYDPLKTDRFNPDWRSVMLPHWREQSYG